MLTHALGFVAAALSVSVSWPQVYKSCVQRRTNGLSATACTLSVAMPIGWVTYGFLAGQRIQVMTNVATGTAAVAILAALLLTQPELRSLRAMRVGVGSAGAVVGVALLSIVATALPGVTGPEVASILGLLLAGVSLLSAIPQPLALLRDRNLDLSGLSPMRWWLAAGSCATWLGYGLLTGQPAVWASAVVGLTSAGIVCSVLFARREARTPAETVTQVTPPRRCAPVTTRNLAMAGG